MPSSSSRPSGQLAIVLHTHMPYVEGGGSWPPATIVEYMEQHGCDFSTALRANPTDYANREGFGTWPFGEEWLWEAVATSYLPLLDVLDERITLSITPVLADQLEAPGVIKRCIGFLEQTRAESHRLDIEHYAGDVRAVAALSRSAAEYATAATRLTRLQSEPGGFLAALGRCAAWTSSATHAILPLLCLDETIACQLSTGITSHRRRFGDWTGGLWLPECAYAPWLAGHLADAGVHHCCIELASADPLSPLATPEGPLLWPIDRGVIDLVWGAEGYPSGAAYRARQALTPRHHRIWANDGAVYDPDRAAAAVARDARPVVAAVSDRVAGGGVCTFAIDTELLGHWWYEGPRWLAAVIAEADARGLTIARHEDVTADALPAPAIPFAISWGEGGDLRTWTSGPAADLAFRLRSAELRALSAPATGDRALRELLAAQSSDWTFLEYRGWAGPYARERAEGHLAALAAALGGTLTEPALRGLAPDLSLR